MAEAGVVKFCVVVGYIYQVLALSDLEQTSDHHCALFHAIWHLSESNMSNSLQLNWYCLQQSCSPGSL